MRMSWSAVLVVLCACGGAVGSGDDAGEAVGGDAGPQPQDAGPATLDAGHSADAGRPVVVADAGGSYDAGTVAAFDAGFVDAGMVIADAGTLVVDAGTPPFCTMSRVTPIAHGLLDEPCIQGTRYGPAYATCDARYSPGFGPSGTGTPLCEINAAAIVYGFDPAGLATVTDPTHQCERTLDKTVRCRGYNFSGQLGLPPSSGFYSNQYVAGLNDIEQVSSGAGAFNCALTAQAKVVCWGDNSAGQLGVPTAQTARSATPLEIAGLTDVVQIATGFDGGCAVTSAGVVSCWGAPWGPTPTVKTDVTGATAIAGSGSVGFCAIVAGGAVKCWGNPSLQGWVYAGTPYDSANLQVAFTITGLSNVTHVAVGDGYTGYGCALDSSGAMTCWGSNHFGQLGDGSGHDSTTPVSPSGLSQVVDISAFGGRACAVWGADRAVSCWGAGVNAGANATTPKLGNAGRHGVTHVFTGSASTYFTTDTFDVVSFF